MAFLERHGRFTAILVLSCSFAAGDGCSVLKFKDIPISSD